MDRETGDIVVYAEKEVVETADGEDFDPALQISLAKAKAMDPNMSWVILSAWR